MQAIILAAGLGKRMYPITNNIPKPLIKIKGKPLIVHLLHSLKKNGIQKVIINLHHLGDQIKNLLQDGCNYGLQILYSEEKELLDTGGGIVNALPLLEQEPFIVVSADIYSEYEFSSLYKKLTGTAHLVLVDNPHFHPQGDFSLEGNQVKLTGNNVLTYANIGIFKKDFFADPPQTIFPLNVLLKRAIKNNLVTGEYFTGNWFNIGTIELLEKAEKLGS